MNIGLAVEMDSELERLSDAIERIDRRLKEFFAEKAYGDDVSNIFIGLILMSQNSERLHPLRPVKYKKQHNLTNRITGQRVELVNVLEFDAKPNYETTRLLNSEAAERCIAENLIEATNQLDRYQWRLPGFDVARFQEDFKTCLQLQPL